MIPATAKTTKPAIRRALGRPNLFEHLDRATADHPVSWIAGPAGSGKTVLLTDWLQARKRACLWYQIDGRDADPATFFYFVRDAVARLAPRKRQALPLLGPEYALGLEAYARNFFEQLGQRLRPGTVIVLDDYHELPEGAPLQALMPIAIGSLPETVRVVVASRAPPPPAFARLVAHGRLAALDPADLRLTAADTRALARLLHGKELSEAEAGALRDRTDGWVAGTVLLLQQREPVAEGYAGSAARDVLFEYFASELFDRAPAAMRRFLLETALLPTMTVQAAEQLTGEAGAAEIFSALVRGNYFTLRLDTQEARFRYHPLFREFLVARGCKAHTAEQWRALTRRAAEAALRDGGPEHAAALMIDSGEHQALGELVTAHAPALVRQGRLATVESWLLAMPADTVARSAWLSYWLGLCESARHPAAGRPQLERAYALFKAAGDATGEYLAWAGYVATFMYVWDRFGPLHPWLEELKALRARHPRFPTKEIEALVTFGAMGAHMWLAAGHPDLEGWVGRARATLRAELPAELRMRLATSLVFFLVWWAGDHRSGVVLLKEMEPLLKERDVTPATEILWRVMEAACYAWAGESEACFLAVERGLATAERCGMLGINFTLAIQGVYGALAAGDLDTARRYHDKARAHLGADEALNRAHFYHFDVWIGLCAGDLPGAEKLVRPMVEHARRSAADFVVGWEPHTLAHLHAAHGRYAEALDKLAEALAWARDRRNAPVQHHCLLSQAHVLLLDGREEEAVEKLREAMTFGRERGYVVHPWIGWRHDVMARLAALALEHGIEPEHVRAQIRQSRLAPPESFAALDAWPWPLRIYTLGTFELRREDARVESTGRVQRKPLELLQGLVALGAKDVREDVLVDALWPDAEGDAARHALETTLYRLRKLIGVPAAVVQRDRRLSLDPRLCWIDAVALQHVLARATATTGEAAVDDARRVVSLYRGPFLAAAGDEVPGAAAARARIRRDLRRLVDVLDRQPRSGARGEALRLRQALADADSDLAGANERASVTG